MLSISRQRNMLNLTLVCGRPVQKKVSKTKVSKQENIYKFHNHNTSCGRFLSEKPMQRLETMSNTPFRNQCRILLAKSFQHVMQKSFTLVSKSNMKIVRPASFVPKLDSLTTDFIASLHAMCEGVWLCPSGANVSCFAVARRASPSTQSCFHVNVFFFGFPCETYISQNSVYERVLRNLAAARDVF